MPQVVVVANPTHEARCEYLARTLESLATYLRCDGQPLPLCVSVEETGLTALDEVTRRHWCDLVASYGQLRVRQGPPHLGAHLNAIIRRRPGEHLLFVPEDWRLIWPLDLGQDVALFGRHDYAGYVRYAKTDSVIKGTFERYYLWPEPGIFPYYSHAPHLRRAGIERWVGELPEDLPHFETEVAMSRRVAQTPVKVFVRPEDCFENLGIVSSLPG